MTASVKQGGVWKAAANIFVKQGGIWKTVQSAYVRQGGVWKLFHAIGSWTLNTTPGDVDRSTALPGFISGTLVLNADGTLGGVGYTGPTNWATPATGSPGAVHSVYFSITGTNYSIVSGTVNTWLSLSAGQTLNLSNSTTTGLAAGTVTVSLSRDGGATTAATFTVGFNIGYDP